ncbi:MAG TPA: hypothetical protein GXZ78_00820 [Eubacteriaceae bacterium]|jgi:uncharacterized membrane protein|nr:hypothetical protein [Eubacteriaceae bacterium]
MTDLKSTLNTQEKIPTFDNEDVEKNKVMAGLAYIIFFLPLIACPESAFGRFHANQGLLLFIFGVVGTFVLGFIPIIGWILLPVLGLLTFAIGIMGLINGLNGKAKELPIIGKFRIIK